MLRCYKARKKYDGWVQHDPELYQCVARRPLSPQHRLMICKVCGEQKLNKRATSAEIPPITHTPTDWTNMGWFLKELSKQGI